MSHKYKFHNPEGVYFVSFSTENWVDVFTRNEYKNIIIDSLCFCQKNKGLNIYAWVIMTNHVHLVISAEGQLSLSDILRDFKRHTSTHVINAIKANPQESRKEWLLAQFSTNDGWRFWSKGNHPIEVWSNTVIEQKINYIHMNPVEAGLVFRPEDYMYSSAIDYAGEKGMLDVELVC